jgi:hypothetical protein
MEPLPEYDDFLKLFDDCDSAQPPTLPFDDLFTRDLTDSTSLGVVIPARVENGDASIDINTASINITEPWNPSVADQNIGISINPHSTRFDNNTLPMSAHVEAPKYLDSGVDRLYGDNVVNFDDLFDNILPPNPDDLQSAAISYSNDSAVERTNHSSFPPQALFDPFQPTLENTGDALAHFESTFPPSGNGIRRLVSQASLSQFPMGFPQFNQTGNWPNAFNPVSVNLSNPDVQFSFASRDTTSLCSTPTQAVRKPLYGSLTKKFYSFDLNSITSCGDANHRSLLPELTPSSGPFSTEINGGVGPAITSLDGTDIEMRMDFSMNFSANGTEMMSNTSVFQIDSDTPQIGRNSTRNLRPLFKRNASEDSNSLTVTKKRFSSFYFTPINFAGNGQIKNLQEQTTILEGKAHWLVSNVEIEILRFLLVFNCI